MNDVDKKVRLENWSIVGVRVIEDETFHLVGIGFGHPFVTDGHTLVTSPIVHMNADASRCRTWNTVYALGLPCSRVEFKRVFYSRLTTYMARACGIPTKIKWVSIEEFRGRFSGVTRIDF